MAEKTKVKKKKSLPLKILDIVVTTILVIILVALLINVILTYVKPNYIPNIFGYQMYTIVTGSMDPYIEVGALVVSKSVKDKQIHKYVRAAEIDAMEGISDEEKARIKESEGVETLPFGTIIVFNGDVDRDGKKEVVTHYFDKIVFENGKVYVATFPEHYEIVDKLDKNGNKVYDDKGNVVKIKQHIDIKSSEEVTHYDDFTTDKLTAPEDIRAIYSTHIVWLGKFLLFLKSIYGIITIIAIVAILLIGSLLIKKVDKNDKKKAEICDGKKEDVEVDNKTIDKEA